jgi:hypothetical protein
MDTKLGYMSLLLEVHGAEIGDALATSDLGERRRSASSRAMRSASITGAVRSSRVLRRTSGRAAERRFMMRRLQDGTASGRMSWIEWPPAKPLHDVHTTAFVKLGRSLADANVVIWSTPVGNSWDIPADPRRYIECPTMPNPAIHRTPYAISPTFRPGTDRNGRLGDRAAIPQKSV